MRNRGSEGHSTPGTTFTTKPFDEAVNLLRSLAVVPTALDVLRSELSAMYQGADESFRTFAAKVQGKAETCEFITAFSGRCTNADCNAQYTGQTYYTVEVTRDVHSKTGLVGIRNLMNGAWTVGAK